jgi:preprotein translocase subunit SecG
MFWALITLQVFICILLTVIILMQSSKGGGLAGTFGGGSVGMMFGVRRTADFLIRATQVLAGTFIVLSLVINIFFLPRSGSTPTESVLQGRSSVQEAPTVPQLPPTLPPTSSPQQGN